VLASGGLSAAGYGVHAFAKMRKVLRGEFDYDAAIAADKYVHPDGRKHYATTNAGEYWAEGVQWWFFSNYGECFAGGVKVETPEEFAAYDPKLNELISRVFTTHRIPMDVFHARRIRPVTCGPS